MACPNAPNFSNPRKIPDSRHASTLRIGRNLVKYLIHGVFHHSGSSKMVVLRIGSGAEFGSVRRSIDVLPLAFLLHVRDLELDIDFSIDGVLDIVLAIVSVDDLSLDVLGLVLHGLDSDLEVVTA